MLIAEIARFRSSRLTLLVLAAATVAWLMIRLRRGEGLDVAALAAGAGICLTIGAAAYTTSKLSKAYIRSLGRNLPQVVLVEPSHGQRLSTELRLRARATDEPGELGPIAAVRRVEFWLYHPSFVEQHAGNHESKVLLATIDGPMSDDAYEATWTCRNPYTPARDGDHESAPGIRSYTLPADGRPYSIQAHGLDDEWFAKPGMPGKSEQVKVDFEPCR